MQHILDAVFNWPLFKGHRTTITQAILMGLAAYHYAITHAILPAVISADTILSLIAVFTAYAAKFAKEHVNHP